MRTASAIVLAVTLFVCACNEEKELAERRAQIADADWFGRCQDTATLLATTAGSPSEHKCPNRRHRMRVQLAAGGSAEEYGALVFCECVPERDRDDAPDGGGA